MIKDWVAPAAAESFLKTKHFFLAKDYQHKSSTCITLQYVHVEGRVFQRAFVVTYPLPHRIVMD